MMIDFLAKKKLLVISVMVILFIFAFGFIGTTFFFLNPDKVYRTPVAPEYEEYCKDPLNALDLNCATKRLTFQPPSFAHPLGTDDQARDELTRLAWGVRHSLEIGLVAGAIITILAIVFGAIAAYYGGWFDDISQFIVNLFLVLPVVPLLIFMSYFTRTTGLVFDFIIPFINLDIFNLDIQGHMVIAVIVGFTSWGWAARAIRSQVLTLKERNFINMAKVSGLGNFAISLYEILPNMFSYITLIFAISLGLSISSEAGISALGIGVDVKFATLGTLLYWVIQLISVTNYMDMIYIYVAPGLIIVIMLVFLYVMQAEMDDVFNPRLKKG